MSDIERDPRLVPGALIQFHTTNERSFLRGQKVVLLDFYKPSAWEKKYRDAEYLSDILVIPINISTNRDFRIYWKDIWNPKRKCRNPSLIWNKISERKSTYVIFIEKRFDNPLLPLNNKSATIYLKRDIWI